MTRYHPDIMKQAKFILGCDFLLEADKIDRLLTLGIDLDDIIEIIYELYPLNI